MSRPSVIFINRVYPPVRGATGRVLRDLAKAFAREGWQVTVVVSGPRAGREKDGGVRVLRVKRRQKPAGFFGYGILWLKLFFASLWLPRADLIVTMSDPPMLILAGRILCKLKKSRHIHWCQDLYPDLFPAIDVKMPGAAMKWMQKLSRRAMNEADKVIVPGRCMAKNLTAQGIDPKQISFIPNWPDFELGRAAQDAEDTEPLASASDINGAKPFEAQIKDGPKFRVLYAGNLGRAHPVDTILGAAGLLDETNPEIEFVFVGDGPRFDYIARERALRGLNNVRLMPYQPPNRLRELMESGDVHLISVRDEAAGLMVPCKLYSAFAVGRPSIYIGPAQTEMAKVVNDFHAGSVARQGRAEELAALIRNYRMNSEAWFAAHEGSVAAGNVFLPKEAIEAWMQRAWAVVEPHVKG